MEQRFDCDTSADKGVFCWLSGEASASEPSPMPPIWPETASDEASTSSREGVGDYWWELREAHSVPSEDDPDLNLPMKARKKKAHHRCRLLRASAGRSPFPSN